MITKTSRTFKNLATERAVVTVICQCMTVLYVNIQAWFVLQNFVTILALESWNSTVGSEFESNYEALAIAVLVRFWFSVVKRPMVSQATESFVILATKKITGAVSAAQNLRKPPNKCQPNSTIAKAKAKGTHTPWRVEKQTTLIASWMLQATKNLPVVPA